MVHNFDSAQKGYIGGEGRQAQWTDLGTEAKALAPRVFVSASETREPILPRVVICDVTGSTNERTALAALLGKQSLAGNSTPTLSADNWRSACELMAVLGSVSADYIIRFRVHTHLNLTYLSKLVAPARSALSEGVLKQIAEHAVLLSCVYPELRDAWEEIFPTAQWSYESAERDPWRRGLLRAELDAIVADAYGLSVAEYARVLSGFPLLDRDQPPLPGDAFVTDSEGTPKGERGVAWEETPFGVYERKPRSFITRDLALLTYMRRKGYSPPQDLHRFYTNIVKIDPDGPLSRFRIGSERDLIDRVEQARRLGAVAYVPSSRGGAAEGEGDEGSGEVLAD